MDDPYISDKSIWREELESFKEGWPDFVKICSICFLIVVAYELITRIAS